MSHFNKRLKALRKQNNLTQYQLAKDLNISCSTISMYECNERKPDIDFLKKVANYFNVTVDFLLSENPHLIENNEDLIGYLHILQNRVEFRKLLDTTKTLTKEEIELLISIIKVLR